MELHKIFTPLRKWWWLIVVSTALAATISYFFSREQPKFYQAKATLFAGRTVLDPNPTSADLYRGQQLALVYTAIAQQNPIISSTIEALGLNELPEYSVRTLPNSQFIEILVTDSIPERAVAVANEMATQLIAQSPGGVEDDGESRRLFITEQLNYLEVKIKETQEDISAAQLILADLDSARDIDEAQATLLALQEKLFTLQATYASLIASAQSTGSNVLTIIESATTAVPVGPEIWLLVFVATALGGSLGIGAAYLIERMDDTLKLSDDIASVLDTKVLGYIPRTKELKTHTEDGNTPYVFKNPLSLATEAFHQLRVNLDFVFGEEAPKTILVTSMGISDGKTT
ncbi:MAG: hypothetical protein MUO58_20545, partial [Anaerolineales bacterium]|nr:hypothetical protein [Anaerolineales bacterium]